MAKNTMRTRNRRYHEQQRFANRQQHRQSREAIKRMRASRRNPFVKNLTKREALAIVRRKERKTAKTDRRSRANKRIRKAARTQRRESVRNFGNRLKTALTQIPNIPVLLGTPKNLSKKNILLGPDGAHKAWTGSHRNVANKVIRAATI